MPIRTVCSLTDASEVNRFTVYYLAILFIMTTVVIYLKIKNLFLMGYTYDLFMFDNVIKNTLLGHFGLEYTFGNQFGEQAYFILLLLIPFKIIFSNNMSIFLILLGTISYFISALLIFFYLRTCLVIREAFFISLSYLFLFGMTFRGLFEFIHGFHPDLIAGFCLLIYTIIEIQRQKKLLEGKAGKLYFIILSVTYVLFISIKQEMALITTIFFFCLFLFSRKRSYLLMACLSFVYFLVGMIFVYLSYTEFNRGNWVLIEGLFKAIQRDGLQFFFQPRIIRYYLYLLFISIPFLIVCVFDYFYNKKYNHYALALFVSALAKSIITLISRDFSILTWHNFPCVEIISGATALQFATWTDSNKQAKKIFIIIFLSFSILPFLLGDFVFYKNQTTRYKHLEKIVPEVKQSLIAAKKIVPEKSIVAIPVMMALWWSDRNFTLYPNGVYSSPKGIADYIVIPKENTGIPVAFFNLISQEKNEVDKFSKDFLLIGENKYFMIFQRDHLQPDHKESREKFFHLFHIDRENSTHYSALKQH
jgi:hypothetical protein